MTKACIVLAVILSVACASSRTSTGPEVGFRIEQVNVPGDVFYFAGPVNIQYRVSVSNPTDQPLTLRRLELRTIGPGAYTLRTNATPANIPIPPKSTAAFTVSAWGHATGGYLASNTPVTLSGTAYFDSASGSFVRILNTNIMPSS